MGKSSSYQIGYEGLHIDQRFALLLADNGEIDDQRQWMMAAPIIDTESKGCAGIYLAGNGDPEALATIGPRGEILWYLGEDAEDEDTEGDTIACALEKFEEFCGLGNAACAEKCAELFALISQD